MKPGALPKMEAIQPEAHDMVRAAAHRAGMSVRDWLNSVIIDAAAAEGVAVTSSVFRHDEGPIERNDGLSAIRARLDDLADQIDYLVQQQEATAVLIDGRFRGYRSHRQRR
jgi:hypothetical protein